MQQGAYWSVLLSVYYLTLSVSVRLNTHTHCRKACFSREVRMQITLRKTADYFHKDTTVFMDKSASKQQRLFVNSGEIISFCCHVKKNIHGRKYTLTF